MHVSSRESPSLATCDTWHTSGPQMHGVSPQQAILCDPAGCPTTELGYDTVYPEMVSDPAGQGLSLTGLPPRPHSNANQKLMLSPGF